MFSRIRRDRRSVRIDASKFRLSRGSFLAHRSAIRKKFVSCPSERNHNNLLKQSHEIVELSRLNAEQIRTKFVSLSNALSGSSASEKMNTLTPTNPFSSFSQRSTSKPSIFGMDKSKS